MIAIVDYQAGNLASVRKAFSRFSQDCMVTSEPVQVCAADKVILPGVGHYSMTAGLSASGLKAAISECIHRGKPVLGICLGLQWLFEGSEEASQLSGLGIFAGVCGRFPAIVKAPHVGWNQVRVVAPSQLLSGIADGSYFYFTHSYRAPLVESATAVCCYGGPFAASVERENVYAVQFHPEKSGDAGLRVVENFCAL